MKDWDWPVSMTCDLCGKPMYVPIKNEWAYKAPTPLRMRKPGMAEVQYFCSWSCLRKFQKKVEQLPCDRGKKKGAKHG